VTVPVSNDGPVGAPGVWRYLDGLGHDHRLAGPDLRRLAVAWWVLLQLHEGEPGGECARCSRGHRGTCTVWQVATGYLGHAW
jgi:hypothetical protein